MFFLAAFSFSSFFNLCPCPVRSSKALSPYTAYLYGQAYDLTVSGAGRCLTREVTSTAI